MRDQPTPTEEENERVPDEQTEHEDMQGPLPPDPDLPGREDDDA
jgi:hypothetical protein